MPDNDDRPVLVAMNADCPRMVPGSIFNRQCSTCGGKVMIAPSGQKYLRQNPHAEIMCYRCYRRSDEDFQFSGLAAEPETIVHEMNSSVPNMRRYRN
jgi:hypothetical protein